MINEMLEIRSTNVCNMDCSFCVRYGEDVPSENLDVSQLIKIAIDLITEKNLKYVVLSGGEPLADVNRTFRIIHVIREFFPEIPISLNTNISLLTPEIVNIINEYDVTVNIGFQSVLGKNKSLETLYKHGSRADEIIEYVKNINNVSYIRIVVDPSAKFASDAYVLHKLFDVNIQIIPNIPDLHKFTYLDLINFESELQYLYNYDRFANRWVSIFGFYEKCDCSQYILYTDGTYKRKIDTLSDGIQRHKDGDWTGCIKIDHHLGKKHPWMFDIVKRFTGSDDI